MARSYIVLVNWNGHHDTIECLESLLRLDDADFHVIVVDNGSADGSIDALQVWAAAPEVRSATWSDAVWDRLPSDRRHAASLRVIGRDDRTMPPADTRITIVAAGANLGFAGANNLGLELASVDPDARHFWVLNNDTVVAPRALSALVSHMKKHPALGIVGAVLLYYHDPAVVQGLGGWLDTRRALSGHIGAGSSADALPLESDVDPRLAYVIGASMFVSRAVYETVGGMSEDYFLYYEELDWAKRLPLGSTLGLCRDAIVFHKEGGSIGTSSTVRPSDTALYYLYRSAMRFYWRHERRHAPLATARIAYNLLDFTRRRDMAAIRVTARAFADALTGRSRRGPFGSAEFRSSGGSRRDA